MPTHPEFGEGRVGRGSNRQMHPFRSAGVVGTARTHGGSSNEGRPAEGEGSGLNVTSGDGHGGSSDRVVRSVDAGYSRWSKGP